MIAFEMARQLRERGETVAFLGMFDSVAPLSPGELPPADERREDASRLAAMIEAIGRFRVRPSQSPSASSPACPPRSKSTSSSPASRARASSPGDERRVIRNLLRVSKARLRAHRTYKAAPAAVPITLFRATEAQRSDYPSAADEALAHESLGWQHLTTERVRILHTDGNHVSMMSAAHTEEIALLLEPCL